MTVICLMLLLAIGITASSVGLNNTVEQMTAEQAPQDVELIFYPEQEGIYSWWSYRFRARAKNAGWRIDYFCVSECLKDRLRDAKILTDVMGSDHCPVELDFE